MQLGVVLRLPQEALKQNMHELLGVLAHNEAVAGLECIFESAPQLLLQLRAYTVTGDANMLNYASLVFSAAGACAAWCSERRPSGRLSQHEK